jgi:hypothetical protein
VRGAFCGCPSDNNSNKWAATSDDIIQRESGPGPKQRAAAFVAASAVRCVRGWRRRLFLVGAAERDARNKPHTAPNLIRERGRPFARPSHWRLALIVCRPAATRRIPAAHSSEQAAARTTTTAANTTTHNDDHTPTLGRLALPVGLGRAGGGAVSTFCRSCRRRLSVFGGRGGGASGI